MKKKYIISISSKQTIDKDDVIEVVTPGEFYKENNKYYAIYDETEISGMEGTKTTLEISENKVALIREGSTNARMDFEEENQCVTLYNTPYGVLELKINTNKIDIDVNDDGGAVFINYDMNISGQGSQTTELNIKIKS